MTRMPRPMRRSRWFTRARARYELAEDNFQRAIKLKSDFSRARNNYAAFLYSQQRYSEAEAQLRQVVTDPLYNARPQAFLNLGMCRLQLKDAAGRRGGFPANPRHAGGQYTIALLELAQLRLEAGDTGGATIYYDEYRKRSPSAKCPRPVVGCTPCAGDWERGRGEQLRTCTAQSVPAVTGVQGTPAKSG
jgi:Tfp pilus assembly protein PilF